MEEKFFCSGTTIQVFKKTFIEVCFKQSSFIQLKALNLLKLILCLGSKQGKLPRLRKPAQLLGYLTGLVLNFNNCSANKIDMTKKSRIVIFFNPISQGIVILV